MQNPQKPQSVNMVGLKPDCDIGLIQAGLSANVVEDKIVVSLILVGARESRIGGAQVHAITMRPVAVLMVDDFIKKFEEAETAVTAPIALAST